MRGGGRDGGETEGGGGGGPASTGGGHERGRQQRGRQGGRAATAVERAVRESRDGPVRASSGAIGGLSGPQPVSAARSACKSCRSTFWHTHDGPSPHTTTRRRGLGPPPATHQWRPRAKRGRAVARGQTARLSAGKVLSRVHCDHLDHGCSPRRLKIWVRARGGGSTCT